MKTKTYFIFTVSLLLSLVLVTQQGCKKENEPPSNGDEELSIPETTKVISQSIWNSNFVGLDSANYTITFKKELANEAPISVGDIIVSQDGYGYLRKVTQIKTEGDEIKVYTSFASLSEAIENGSFSFETVLSEQKIMKISYLKEGVILDTSNMKSTEETAMEYDIDVYLDKPDNNVHLTGSFVLLPAVNAELIIKWFKVKKLKVEFVVDEQINLENTIELLDIQYEKEVKLAGIVFHPIIVMIGTMPIVIVPELEIFAGAELDAESTVTTSVDQSLNYTAGMLYENSEWSTYKELNKQLNYSPPSLTATATATAYIKPRLNLKFYGTVAPYLNGLLYGRIDAELQTDPWWSLYGGVNIVAGVEMEIFGEELFDYYTDPPIIEYEQLIVDANDMGGNQAPGLPTNPAPPNNATDQSVNVDISWTCSDPDDDPLTYDVYFGETSSPALVLSNSSSTSYDPGTLNENATYYWKIIAKDDHNNTTEGLVWQFTTTDGSNNQAPELPSNPVPANQATNISTTTLLEWACTDPEEDPLTFDVYFGTDNPPSIAATNQSEFSFNPGTLTQNTQYYWKIVAKDDHGNQTEGPVWTFTTTGGGDTFTDLRDGQTYNIVDIGSQTWFAENLKYLPSVSPSSDGSFSSPYYYVYDYQGNNVSEAKATTNYQTYGVLYNWPAAMNACPVGWHLPGDDEWKTLEMYLGMSQSEADQTGWRGTDEGGKLKETGTAHWDSPNTGATNSSSFTALPGGYRDVTLFFDGLGYSGLWWSATEDNYDNAWIRDLHSDYEGVSRYLDFWEDGYSVRCLRD